MSDAIHQLNREVTRRNTFTHKEINRYMDQVYHLKEKNFDNEKNYMRLNHIEEYLKYQNQKLDSFKTTVMSLINTVFLPLGVLTGFFGMNFASMGNPDIKRGVLSIQNSEYFVFGLMTFFFVVTLIMFELLFGIHI
jgi:Mg2+ and Co2+ transporter CorA